MYELFDDNFDNDYNADNADHIDNVKTYFGSGRKSFASLVGGRAVPFYAGVDSNANSVPALPGGVPMAMSTVPAASSVNQHLPSGRMRDCIRYCADFEAQYLQVPEAEFPYGVIRQHIGRGTKVPPSEKKPITKEMTRSVAWHARMTEDVSRFLSRSWPWAIGGPLFSWS